MMRQPELSAIWICSDLDLWSASGHEFNWNETLDEYLQALQSLSRGCELIIVCNGAKSGEYAGLKERILANSNSAAVSASIVDLHQRCDESTALTSGIEAARGELIAVLPSYLQSDPNDLVKMVQQIDKGADYVASWRRHRVDSWWLGLNSRMFNSITRRLTGVPLHDLNCGLRVMRREVPESISFYGDLHRFLPVLAAKQGFQVAELETRHLCERVRKGDYRFGVYLRRALDLLTLFFLLKFTAKPLRFFGIIGSATVGIGAILLIVLGVQRLLGTALADRPLLVVAVLSIVLGIQLFSLGLLGELMIFTNGRSKEYAIRRVYESNGH